MSDRERKAWAGEAARSRAAFVRREATELVDHARLILWSCARECEFARNLVREAARLRQPAGQR